MHRRSSVILIREWDRQLSGSGCCGRVDGDFTQCRGEAVFAERRAIMERMGSIYRLLRARFGDAVDVQVVDPRNVSLLLILVGDFWRFRVAPRTALKTIFGLPPQAVVVNGRLVDRSPWPDGERIADIIEAAIGRDALPGAPAAEPAGI